MDAGATRATREYDITGFDGITGSAAISGSPHGFTDFNGNLHETILIPTFRLRIHICTLRPEGFCLLAGREADTVTDGEQQRSARNTVELTVDSRQN
jgi:hypothetical protein